MGDRQLVRARWLRAAVVVGLAWLTVLPSAGWRARAISYDVVISQVYGGGGNSGATFTHDFIELFNRGALPVSLAGWSLQYAAAAGNFGSVVVPLPDVLLLPGQFFLVQMAPGAGGSQPLPEPDLVNGGALNASAGKVALVRTAYPLTGVACPAPSIVVDLVGYGASASCFEGNGPAPSPSNILAAVRTDPCSDRDHNPSDFSAAPPLPRNSQSARVSCPLLDLAPAVASTQPLDGAVWVDQDASLRVTFNEEVETAPGWISLECGGQQQPLTQTGGPRTYTLAPLDWLPAGSTCSAQIDPARVTDLDGSPDVMEQAFTWTFSILTPCDSNFIPIYTIQGSGSSSPLVGTQVTTQGVITSRFLSGSGPAVGGYFVQDPAGDGRLQTADGFFVVLPAGSPVHVLSLSPGDRVKVVGTVSEANQLTQLNDLVSLERCGQAMVTPLVIDLPLPPGVSWEQFEGMLVTISSSLAASDNYYLGRFGQLMLSVGGRLFHPNSGVQNFPTDLAARVIILDDGRSGQNPSPLPYLPGGSPPRGGDEVSGLLGVIDQGSISADPTLNGYRLQPLHTPVFAQVNPRSPQPPLVAQAGRTADLVIASFNLGNYFTTLDQAPYPPGSPYTAWAAPRGADSALEFERQQGKLVTALAALQADVLSLVEIEAWSGAQAVDSLVDALNAEAGIPGLYAAVPDPETGTGGDMIKNGLLYKTTRVRAVGPSMSLNIPLFERAPIAQVFETLDRAERFTVVVNHFKSRVCGSASGDELDHGQGCWNARRVRQAEALLGLIQSQLQPLDPDLLVIGDLNSLPAEDPLLTLQGGGLVDLVRLTNPTEPVYSYVYDGMAGALDHALGSASLVVKTSGAEYWHINADEAPVIDYNLEFKTHDLYARDPFRSSDHDPLLVGLTYSELALYYLSLITR